jgi:hypothetical protein
MAITDQRAGFRLPWNSDPRSNNDSNDGADTAEATAAPELTDAPDKPDAEARATEATATVATERNGATETAGPDAAEHPSTETPSVPADATPTETSTAGPKRPTKFLADLTRAMQAAAESARTQAVTQLAADAKAFVEDIHSRSATEASEIRRRADDDVATIRDWSKAEIARIREETEGRISARKVVLETQLEQHAGAIEREIERIQGRVSTFEAEMAGFFERLLAEDDPTKFAVMAENLPEPPPFESRTLNTDELLAELTAAVAVVEPPTQASDVVEADAVEVTDAATGTVDAEAADGDPEAAMAAIQAAFEAAAQTEAEATNAEVATQDAGAAPDAVADGTPETEGETSNETGEVTAEADPNGGGDTENATDPDDPRLAVLALSDFDAAEAEAAATIAATNEDEIPTLSDDALAARLNVLVPPHGEDRKNGAEGPGTSSQVVVVGLVSVASIASFKRHLGRITGVHAVGVSSGPDGEFVFAVNHDEEVSLRDVVPTLPGFQARVTNSGDGIVNVAAHDPESEG